MTALRRFLTETWAEMANLPVPLRMCLSGALACGIVGGLCGLVMGLIAYPPTAWFAVLEVGVPAGLVGGVGGLVLGSLLGLARAVRRTR